MSLYHWCLTWLEPRSIIKPGNYGRVIRLQGDASQFWDRENVLERVRALEFPDKPSRLESTFVFDNVDTARFWGDRFCSTGVLYEVTATDPSAPSHTGDFNCIQPLPRRAESMEEIARRYWRADLWTNIQERPGLRCAEIVLGTSLIILREVW